MSQHQQYAWLSFFQRPNGFARFCNIGWSNTCTPPKLLSGTIVPGVTVCHSAAWLLADFNGLPVKCPGSNLSPHLRKAAGAPEYLGVATYGQPLRVILEIKRPSATSFLSLQFSSIPPCPRLSYPHSSYTLSLLAHSPCPCQLCSKPSRFSG